MQLIVVCAFAMVLVSTASAFDDEWDDRWDVDRKVRYLELHQDEREQHLSQGDRMLRDHYFHRHNDEAGDFYGRHSEFGREWNGMPNEGLWDSQWDVDRKIHYLELHQDEREQRLIEDQALRQRYFQLHREEADAFYRRHAEFASEWNADPLALPAGGWDNSWDMDRKMRYLELHQDEREQHLQEDQALRQRYFQLHRDEADAFYRRHTEFGGEWNGHRRFARLSRR